LRIIDAASAKPPKCYLDSERDVVDWILDPLSASEFASDRARFQSFTAKPGGHAKSRHKSLDCSIMDVADDIATASMILRMPSRSTSSTARLLSRR
jgi:dGTPase